MNILIVPDSYKGTLTSKQVCSCIAQGLLNAMPKAQITALPFSDGGEGFAECMSNACNGNILYTDCHDIYLSKLRTSYYTYEKTAVIECAKASGIQKRKDIMHATSYGTGELIKHAVSKGFKHIILGLGGTGCCDGGAGALAALGVKFKDIYGEIISYPAGGDLNEIYGVDFKSAVKDIYFTYACDVDNPYYGKNGAAYIFAPQKGAKKNDVATLDDGLKRLAAFLPNNISELKGAGAAGGICGGLYAVYSGEIKSGFDILSQAYDLEQKIKNADLVVTGEGKTDSQTLMGKLPYKISLLCKKHGKKCVIISGSIEGVKLGDKMISLADNDTPIEEAINNAEKVLCDKSKFILQ